jgi:hypothetical protein
MIINLRETERLLDQEKNCLGVRKLVWKYL